jgi:hypothetical protein
MGGMHVANFKLSSSQSVVAVILIGLAGLGSAIYLNRPSPRISLPPGAEFPACLVVDPRPVIEKCDTTNCVPPVLMTYREVAPFGAEDKRWCCPFGSHPNATKSPPTCVVDAKRP